MMTDEERKDVVALCKCPFCGNARVRLEQNAYDAWYVHCTNCGARGPISPVCNRNFAVDSWNRRTVDVDELELMVERFETLLNIADSADIDLSKPPSMLFDRLADLIDRPTTTLIEDEDGRTRCANCGCTALYMSDAAYCPDCGAEVVKWRYTSATAAGKALSSS